MIAVASLAAVCIAMRVSVPLLLGDRRPERLERSLHLAVPALLGALIASGTLLDGTQPTVDARLAGVTAAGVIVACRGPLALAVLAAAGLTAALRLLA